MTTQPLHSCLHTDEISEIRVLQTKVEVLEANDDRQRDKGDKIITILDEIKKEQGNFRVEVIREIGELKTGYAVQEHKIRSIARSASIKWAAVITTVGGIVIGILQYVK